MKPATRSSESAEVTNENALPAEFLINSHPVLRGKRQVLGDKTPLKAFSPSPHSKSPLKQVLSTPAPSTHPVLRDITNSAQALKNPPDLFPVTSTVKRSRRLQKKLKEAEPEPSKPVEDEKQEELIPSKLATTVFPNSDTEADREIEHPTGALTNEDDDDELKGLSKIIPQLTDFSKNLTAEETEDEFEKRCVIEVVEVPFVWPEDDCE